MALCLGANTVAETQVMPLLAGRFGVVVVTNGPQKGRKMGQTGRKGGNGGKLGEGRDIL